MNSLEKKILGLFLIILIYSLYSKESKYKITDNELVKVSETLKQKPILGATGGDMPHRYISFYFDGKSGEFFAVECSYKLLNIALIERLESGDSLHVWIKKENILKNNKKIYALYVPKFEYELTLSSFNNCYVNKWKPIMLISFITLLGFIVVFIKNRITPR